MKDLAGLELTPEDFAVLHALCREDPRFPANWQSWARLMRVAASDAVAAGSIPAALSLNPQHFETWCVHVGIVPCVDALRAFSIVHRSAWTAGRGAR